MHNISIGTCMDKTKKQKDPSLKINILLNMFYQVLSVITPLITAPYISRVLQADGVGINSYTTSLLTFFTLFASLGTSSYGKKVIAELREDKSAYSRAFWEIEAITIFTATISLILWLILSIYYSIYRPYMLVLSFTLLATLFDISWLYGGLEKFQYIVVVNSLCKIAAVICVFLLVNTKDDVLTYTAIMSFSTLFGSASMWLFLPRFVEKVPIKLNEIKRHIKGTIIYFGPAIATSVYTILDKTLIGLITQSNVENGYYEQATKIINTIKSVCFDGINGVMISRASFIFHQKDKAKLNDLRDATYHLVSLLSVGACFGIIGVSNIFVPVFFGAGYMPVIELLNILAIVVVVIGISSVANSIYYIAGGKMRQATRLILIGSTINLICNLLLIPKFASKGATIATLIAESVITVSFVKETNGFIKWSDISKLYCKKIASGLIMLAGIKMIHRSVSALNNGMILVTEIVFGSVVYFGSLIVLKDPSINVCRNFLKKERY